MTIFLDIDGVLNKQSDWIKPFTINQACLNVFIQLVKELKKRYKEVDIVLTSTWRNSLAKNSNNELVSGKTNILDETFKKNGLSIYGTTPVSNKTRQEEIEYYIRRNNITHFITIDDDLSLFTNPIAVNLYLTDYTTGLTSKDIKKILKLCK